MTDPSQQFDSWQREQYRKSMDTILVYNPTEIDYVCIWDKYPHVIPSCKKDMGFGLGKMQLVRYIADKYMREMKDKMITQKADKLLDKTKEAREAKGLSIDPSEVNTQILNTAPRTNNEKEIEEAYGLLYCGLVREFGLYDNTSQVEEVKLDQRTPEERAMDKVVNKPKEVPQAQNAVVTEPDDLTTAPENEVITPNGLKVTYTKEIPKKKSRFTSDEE